MNVSLNGSTPDAGQRGLRWAWFGGSIISDWNNPIATTNRAVIRALQQRGHQVTFFEPSDSPAFLDALKERGSDIYRAFQTAYPDIHYRRETLPGGSEGDVWLSRETALADVLIVQDGAPAQIVDWLQRVPASPIVRLFLAQTEATAVDVLAAFDAVISPASVDADARYGPAVLRDNGPGATTRSGELTVVYRGHHVDASGSGTVVASGAGAPEELPFVPEARLPERYRTVAGVTIVDDDPAPFAAARAMLAVASGANVRLMRAGGESTPVDACDDADQQAGRLVRLVASVRARRLHIQE